MKNERKSHPDGCTWLYCFYKFLFNWNINILVKRIIHFEILLCTVTIN